MTQYKDIEFLDSKKNILLAKDTATNVTYVKKYISEEQRKIYQCIRENSFEGVPRVIDIYPENDYFILIEEYIQGKTLQQIIDKKSIIFTPSFAEEIVLFLCKTLSPIHKKKIIHRDITASNIIYTFDNKLYLIDFGNARVRKDNQATDTEFIGTQNYAAPEQFGFGQSDRRTDIYAIGRLTNLLLTGGKFPEEQLYKGKLAKVIKKCTAIKPKDRYKSVSQLKHAMSRANRRFITSVPMMIIYAIILFVVAFLSIALIASSTGTQSTDSESYYKAIPTSRPDEKAYRRWSDIKNLIADGNYEEAQNRLDVALDEGLYGFNVYLLYSQSLEAQGKYDESAQMMIDCFNAQPNKDNFTKDSPIFKRLEYLRPYCSADVQANIDNFLQSIQ